jgi:hypothetical protein
VKLKVADMLATGPAGPPVIIVSGASLSAVQDTADGADRLPEWSTART